MEEGTTEKDFKMPILNSKPNVGMYSIVQYIVQCTIIVHVVAE